MDICVVPRFFLFLIFQLYNLRGKNFPEKSPVEKKIIEIHVKYSLTKLNINMNFNYYFV